MAEDDTWNTLEVSNTDDKVEYEIEGAEEEAPVEEAPKEVEAPELEGIETQGAQKRIRQLVKQRREKDDHINRLVEENEALLQQLTYKNTEVKEITKV